MKRIYLIIVIISLLTFRTFGREGMWIPMLLEKYNITEMQQMGFKLTAKDIYDVNNSSMKDAVVLFGNGCTGELISNNGLLITNHHCGLRQVQQHSSIEHDYLSNGFWAMNKEQELPNQGLTISFLEYMEDVTEKVLGGTTGLEKDEKEKQIQKNIVAIRKDAEKGGKFSSQVKPLFYGNQYFLYVFKIYKDVRLVGAPPSAIGKFGGDTDNWMWPRHTGDFTIFRVYAGKDNEPAEYSPQNVPFQPKKFFSISLKENKQGDFTMVFGYPGTTMEYIPSDEVAIILNQRDPDRVKVRDKKLDIIGTAMEKDPVVRIQYTAKYQGISNAWKKWQGEIKGLNRMDAIGLKKQFEMDFQNWATQNGTWESEYKPVFDNFKTLYARYEKYIKASDYYSEILLNGPEIFTFASQANMLVEAIEKNDTSKIKSTRIALSKSVSGIFKNFNQSTDEKLFATLLPLLNNGLDNFFLPEKYKETTGKLNPSDLMNKLYAKSVLTDSVYWKKLLLKGSDKQILKLKKDPVFALWNQLRQKYEKDISPVVLSTTSEITANMKVYMAGIMEMKKGKALYPDANLTLRVAYGKIERFQPADGVTYNHFTTLKGIIEKDNPAVYDYDVPDRLKELYASKDFGNYAVKGDIPVCFIASNHTTGGNSGSPVLNAEGHLIGINFDRAWEGTMSDIMYDPEMCRNISLDMHFMLFIVDKFAGAGYLLNEMKIIE